MAETGWSYIKNNTVEYTSDVLNIFSKPFPYYLKLSYFTVAEIFIAPKVHAYYYPLSATSLATIYMSFRVKRGILSLDY